MKLFLSHRGRKNRGGFSLVEIAFSIGLLSFSVLTLTSLLAVGLKNAHVAHDDRAATQIAQALVEKARQGSLADGTTYLNSDGTACPMTQATYTAQAASVPLAGNASLTQTTLRLTPLGAPDRVRTYAVIFPSAQ